ncbi:MAG: ComEC/Rec2 family competence protein, partial [Cyanobacteria bacterium P01_H01_bin.121]
MPPINSLILILAYVVGLMATVMPAQLGVLNLSSLGLLILGIIAAGVVPRYWRVGPRSRLWLTAGVIACLAGLYFNWRLPQPSTSDISQLLTLTENPSQIVTVQGRIQKTPRLTRSQRVQFWLKVQQAIALEDIPQVETETETETVQPANQDWRGKVYVTVPLLQGTGLHPGEWVSVTGRLYQPQASSNPGGFDFRAYLERQGSFAGLKGDRLEIIDVQTGLRFGWWQIRDRIIRTQTLAMGSPAGPLVSAMVLGNRVVDLPFRIRDQFARLGLAHTIAASGFHVSLILGVVLWLAKRRSPRVRFFTGLTALLLYIGLTGLQPSILRASIMGIGALVGMLLDRSTKPLGALLFAAVLLLIWNPLWIWDLGFQLSFLATFGLLTTAPAIVKRLDWLPPIIANLLAVPLAAMLWTLPLQLHVFGIFSPYSIIINILATPFIWALSLGGVLSSLAALIWQPLGLGLAWILQYPAQALITGVATFNVLPGSSVALGKASLLQVAALYSLMGSVTLLRPGPWKWRAIALVMLGVILIPAWYRQSLLVQTTIFANTEPPTMLVQDQGTIGLINSGGETTARYVVLPFLRHQGINEIHWAVNTSNTSDNLQGWLRILEDTPIRRFYNGVDQAVADTPDTEGNLQARTGDFQQQWDRWAKTILQQDLSARDGTYKTADTQQAIALPQATLQLLDAASQLWEYQTSQAQWLWVLPATSTNRLAFDQVQNFQGLLWWDGSALPSEFLDS